MLRIWYHGKYFKITWQWLIIQIRITFVKFVNWFDNNYTKIIFRKFTVNKNLKSESSKCNYTKMIFREFIVNKNLKS